MRSIVIPAKAVIRSFREVTEYMDARLRGHDDFCEIIKVRPYRPLSSVYSLHTTAALFMPLFLLLVAYLVGSIPFGLLLARTMGVDVRRAGSGNIGATNVARLAGRKLGVLTLLADMAKGAIPMLLAGVILGGGDGSRSWVILCGLSAFLGHLFPLYLGFRGGKGVATALGVFLVMQPLAALFCLAVFIVTVKISGYVSLGSLSAAALMPFFVWLLRGEPFTLAVATVMALLIWLRHRDNIVRLRRGEEKSWKG